MQFIDHATPYNRKSITLGRALEDERARLIAVPDADRLMICFRPDLKQAMAFDRDIDERLEFKALSTAEKLDLMIEELLPLFFHPDLLVLTGREIWHARLIVDGSVERLLRMDDRGLHDATGSVVAAEIELETDAITLLALLRAEIAKFHHTRPPYPALPQSAFGPDADDEVWGE